MRGDLMFLLVGIPVFIVGAVLGAILQFRFFLRASLLVGAGLVILGVLGARGAYPIVMTLMTSILFVLLMLTGAAVGITLKKAWRER